MTRRKATGSSSWRREWWGAALLALSSVAATGGCADHVQGGVVACPCDTGVCCASGVCAADENACVQATEALSSASAGRWTGYVENYTFPSGSDALDFTLQVENDGSLSGRLVLGAGSPPGFPSDGTGWPPDELDTRSAPLQLGAMEGFAYHAVNPRWTALRLRFEVSLSEPWGAWCRSQHPQAAPNGWPCGDRNTGYQNGDECAIGDDPGGSVPVDCHWLQLCVIGEGPGSCSCGANGCDVSSTPTVAVDVALRSDAGDGSIVRPTFDGAPVHNVRLIRASN